jgi:hypothetical protein
MSYCPDNLKSTIMWLRDRWIESGLELDFEDFCMDMAEIGCEADEGLTEDARELKRKLLGRA